MNKINIFFLLIMVLLFAQCSIATHIYIHNLSAETVKFKIFYKEPLTRIPLYQHEQIFDYTEGIVSPKIFRQEIHKSLKFQKLNDSAVVVEIPKVSTARIVTTSNSSYHIYVDHLEYEGKRLALDDFIAAARHYGSHIVYTIKPNKISR